MGSEDGRGTDTTIGLDIAKSAFPAHYGRCKQTYGLASSVRRVCDIIPAPGRARVFSNCRRCVCTGLMLLRRPIFGLQRNSVPSTHMRCMMSRPTAAPAPRCLTSSRGVWRCFSRPGLEPGPFRRAHQHDLGRFVEHHPHHRHLHSRDVAPAARRPRLTRCLAGVRPNTGIAPPLELRKRAGTSTVARSVSATTGPTSGHRKLHQAPAHIIVPNDGQRGAHAKSV